MYEEREVAKEKPPGDVPSVADTTISFSQRLKHEELWKLLFPQAQMFSFKHLHHLILRGVEMNEPSIEALVVELTDNQMQFPP